MQRVESWLVENKHRIINYQDEETVYIILPFGVIMKNNDKYLISFDIEEDKSFCFDFYEDISKCFLGIIEFDIYYDCYFELTEMDEIAVILFGDEAATAYFDYLKLINENNMKVPKKIVWN